ncbi:hypothetical protein VTK26DRAFT_3844 [Humicola hyalothermophila]
MNPRRTIWVVSLGVANRGLAPLLIIGRSSLRLKGGSAPCRLLALNSAPMHGGASGCRPFAEVDRDPEPPEFCPDIVNSELTEGFNAPFDRTFSSGRSRKTGKHVRLV